MPKESDHFKCPCCGMHAPIERVTEEGPFPLEFWTKRLGGKRKLTPEEREDRKGQLPAWGSAPGILDYDKGEVTPELTELVKERLAEVERELS